MKRTLSNIFSGLGSLPVILFFIIGVGLASGVNLHFLLIGIIITNVLNISFNKEGVEFYSLSPSLGVILLSLFGSSFSEPSVTSVITFMIPALLFVLVSYIPFDFHKIPLNISPTILLSIGLLIVLKQIPHAFVFNSIEFPEFRQEKNTFQELIYFYTQIDIYHWLHFLSVVSIVILLFIGKRYFKKFNIVLIIFSFAVLVSYLLPSFKELIQISSLQIHFNHIFFEDFKSINIYQAIKNGFIIFFILLFITIGNYSALESFNITKAKNFKKSIRLNGFSNMFTAILGFFPANVSLVDSVILNHNKEGNRISIITIIMSLIIIAIVDIPDFYFPLFIVSSLLIYIGLTMIRCSITILRNQPVSIKIISYVGVLITMFMNYTYGIIFALALGLVVHKVFNNNND